MSTTVRESALFLLVFCYLCKSNQVPELSYLQCVNANSLNPKTVLIFPLNQTELTQPGYLECTWNCVEIDINYVYFFVHVPASGIFTNQLVCGCGTSKALLSVPDLPDSSCNLPCPQGVNATIDAVYLTGGSNNKSEVIEPWLLGRPGVTSAPSKGRFFNPSEGVASTQGKRRHRPPGHLRTCGDGHGLISVYEFRLNGSTSTKISIGTLVLSLLLLCVNFSFVRNHQS